MWFEFKKDQSKLDDRSVFANTICKLLINKYNNSIDEALLHVGPIYKDFEEHVRNVYELINDEIPLFALYDLKKEGAADNFGLSDDEYTQALANTEKACIEYYNLKS